MCSFQGLCLYSNLKNLVYQTACFLSYHIPTLCLLVVPPPPPSCYQAGGHNLSHLSSYESTNIFQIFKKYIFLLGNPLASFVYLPLSLLSNVQVFWVFQTNSYSQTYPDILRILLFPYALASLVLLGNIVWSFATFLYKSN